MSTLNHLGREALTSGARLERWLLGMACFFWGTSQIAPPNSIADFSFARVNYGDLVFFILVTLLSTSAAFKDHVRLFLIECRIFSLLVVVFVAIGMVSSYTNAYSKNLELNDIIEVCRPFYYLMLVALVSYIVIRGGVLAVASTYVAGIMIGSAANLAQILSIDIERLSEGLLIFFNPNVTGHMLAVALFFSAILVHFGWVLRGILIANISLLLVFFSLSKGAWLMAAIALVCFALIYRWKYEKGELRGTGGGILIWLSLVALIVATVINFEIIEAAFRVKLEQSFNDETTQSESSVALRFGHIVSSLDMASENPIFGVGVTNWQAENTANSYWLNDVFLSNDNPHNAFFYILSCLGTPALFVFVAIMMFPVAALPKALELHHSKALIMQLLLFAFLFLSGSVQLHIVTHYFLWIICGITFGCVLRIRKQERVNVLSEARLVPI
jgi:O-antigen ligase